jgi:hypothetical protein
MHGMAKKAKKAKAAKKRTSKRKKASPGMLASTMKSVRKQARKLGL